MTIDIPAATSDYQAALHGAAVVEEPSAGRLFMRGRDRAALLHRLSTNDIERLRPGQGNTTVLTTPIGRIIDLVVVYALDDALLLITSAGQGPAVFSHLKKNIFFNDQVTLEPAGRSHGQLALYGPAAPEVLAGLGASLPSLALHQHTAATPAGIPVQIARRQPIGGNGFTLIVPAQQMPALQEALSTAGVVTLSAATFETLRIEQGYPAFGHELSQEYIPLETGLLDAISFSKGCYVGQEIIARMESRNRLAKQLRGLKLREVNSELPVPTKLLVDGKDAGDLTSVTHSPLHGPIALGYVRTAHAEPGSIVTISGTEIEAEVSVLPFA